LYCLKCGRDTGGKQVFCKACQDTMKRYPIKPDTKVLLPSGKLHLYPAVKVRGNVPFLRKSASPG